jgi:transposase
VKLLQQSFHRRSTTLATTAALRVDQQTVFTPPLFLAFALGEHKWKLGGTTGAAQRPRERHVPAGDGQAVLEERRRAKSRFDWPEAARVVSCSAAGRDGWWLHRFFVSQGVEHCVVDSASMAVHRRSRRAKTARLDVPKLLTMLWRHAAGEKQGWRVVRVPRVGDADRRPLPRDLLTTKRERTRVRNRRKGLLAGSGLRMGWQGEVDTPREPVRQWDGAPLPAALRARLKRAWQQVQGLPEQSTPLEAARRAARRTRAEPVMAKVRQLTTRRGIGVHRAWCCVMACFAWRDVQTPQQVGACAGRTPTPSQRGQASRERGITQAGNGSRRTMAREMAWGWVRLQPTRTLTPWSQARCGQGRAR